jgi:hypothetical protein
MRNGARRRRISTGSPRALRYNPIWDLMRFLRAFRLLQFVTPERIKATLMSYDPTLS